MKKLLIFALSFSFLFVSCKGKTDNQNEEGEVTTEEAVAETAVTDAFPWEFPASVDLDLTVGQYVLSPYTFYPKAVEEGKELLAETYIFYSNTIKEVGEEKSMVNNSLMPHSLIIPLPMGETAKKGDILLTWWQGGSGMQRAIVTDASNPAEPIVDFLDLNYSDDPEKPSLANKESGKQLKPNSFAVLKEGEWQSGMPLAFYDGKDWNTGRLIHTNGDQVLLLSSSGKIMAGGKGYTKLLTINPDFAPGDEVHALFVSKFRDGYKVVKYDKSIGRVWVEGGLGNKIEIMNIFEVSKDIE